MRQPCEPHTPQQKKLNTFTETFENITPPLEKNQFLQIKMQYVTYNNPQPPDVYKFFIIFVPWIDIKI